MSQTRLSDYQVDLIGKYVAGQFLSGTPEYEDMLRHELSNTSASDFVVGSLPASPGYSLSTNILDHEETKVYIDICYNCNIPRPAVSDPEIFEAALKGKGDYRVPYFIQEPTLYKSKDRLLCIDFLI
ncbi:hypothetical protein BY458DRAFT_105968 [Sporodiniella umbellata]|nr:hypothetical protein BY458DRAFT_105968 [Sporodiniella umbellata]